MYGKFLRDTAGYEINTFNLPTSWEYIYENRDVLLKVDQFGPVYAQAHPPGDIMLFKREVHEKYSPWIIHIDNKFTNFFRPNRLDAEKEPQNVKITYLPECAKYSFVYDNLSVSTEFIIPKSGTTIAMRFKLKNLGDKRTIDIKPQLVPYLNEAQMAPWDKPEWYLDSSCEKKEKLIFKTKLLSADANSEKRRIAYFETSTDELQEYELSLEKFIGQGDTTKPQFSYANSSRLYAYPPVYATSYKWDLEKNEEKTLIQFLTLESETVSIDFDEAKAERKKVFDTLFSKNKIKTNDDDFDYYANYWLPLQMNWVASLDRGWPTGMRGSRDSAQDYSALLYSDTKHPRDIIFTMLECQRSDGWFPRQYSAKGRNGKHDLRTHVDGGAFFVEFVWKYLAHTKDWCLLEEEIEWLDNDEKASVLRHIIVAAEYYIKPENIGEHGLCKIRGGDWLDAVNTAGLEGRGESVTVSEQTVMSMLYLTDILKTLGKSTDKYIKAAKEIKENINKYAFNKSGYYNGVYNDNGKWIFSECDPDNKARMYGVSNYYAIISGVADEEKTASVLRNAKDLKCDKGYRLFYPCLGEVPIDKVGRIASGDVPPYMGENGNVYNHGSQGFFARALSVAGEGNMLFDMLKWIMPYDQSKHPTASVMTPPYAIVNCYQQLPVFDHRGLMCFLTGSVAMAMRGTFEWLAGIKPCLDGLEIDPCLPETMKNIIVSFELFNKKHTLEIINGDTVILDNKTVSDRRKNMITGKTVWFIKL